MVSESHSITHFGLDDYSQNNHVRQRIAILFSYTLRRQSRLQVRRPNGDIDEILCAVESEDEEVNS